MGSLFSLFNQENLAVGSDKQNDFGRFLKYELAKSSSGESAPFPLVLLPVLSPFRLFVSFGSSTPDFGPNVRDVSF